MSRYYSETSTGRPGISSRDVVESTLSLLGGLAIGAGLMYLLDPDEGSKRRKTITLGTAGALEGAREGLSSAWESVSDTAGSLSHRAADRTRSYARSAKDYARQSKRRWVGHEPEEAGHSAASLVATAIVAGAVGAAIMYALFPETGIQQRRQLRTRAEQAYRRAGDTARSSGQYLRDQASRIRGGGSGEQAPQPEQGAAHPGANA